MFSSYLSLPFLPRETPFKGGTLRCWNFNLVLLPWPFTSPLIFLFTPSEASTRKFNFWSQTENDLISKWNIMTSGRIRFSQRSFPWAFGVVIDVTASKWSGNISLESIKGLFTQQFDEKRSSRFYTSHGFHDIEAIRIKSDMLQKHLTSSQ